MLTGYKVLQEQSIFDLVNGFYGGFDQMYDFIQANPELESIEYDFNANPNTVVYYDGSILPNTPSEIPVLPIESTSTIQTIKAIDGQNVFDICAMTYGTFDKMYKLIQDSILKSIEESVLGVNFTFDSSLVDDDIFFQYLQTENIAIGTGDTEPQDVLLQEDGYEILLESGGAILL